MHPYTHAHNIYVRIYCMYTYTYSVLLALMQAMQGKAGIAHCLAIDEQN